MIIIIYKLAQIGIKSKHTTSAKKSVKEKNFWSTELRLKDKNLGYCIK